MRTVLTNKGSWWIIGKSIGFKIYTVIDVILTVPAKRYTTWHFQTFFKVSTAGAINFTSFYLILYGR